MSYNVHYTGKFYKGLTREMKSPSHSTKITYEVGKTYDALGFEVSDEACGPGIHVVTSIALALKWGPVVVEIAIPDGAVVVWSNDKLRTSRVSVVGVADLSRADLSRANLSVVDLSGADLSGADLSGANLSWANLSGANLSGADLSWANLSGADLSGANLSRANLSVANLSWANLSGANLSWADLSWANLSGADLSGANLSGANLSGANLSGAYGEPKSLPYGWHYVNGVIVPIVKGEEVQS